MRRLMTLLAGLAMMLAITGSANAGYWSVTYDLGGSEAITTNAGGTYTDPIVGKWRFEFDSAVQSGPGPFTSPARVAAGTWDSDIYQNAGIILVSSDIHSQLLPLTTDPGVSIVGKTLSAFTVGNHDQEGYIHCDDFGAGTCIALFGAPSTFNIPQNASGPVAFPKLVFTGAFAGELNKGFTSDPVVVTFGTAQITTTYRGTELSRYYITGDVPALSGGALVGLAAFLLIGGTSTLALRNRRS